MDPIAAELQSLRTELRRTRRGLVALFLGLLAVAFSAQAPSGPKELRADRLVLGTPEKGIVLEAGPKGSTITLMADQARVTLFANGTLASLEAQASDRDNPKHLRGVGMGAGGSSALTRLSVTDQEQGTKDDVLRQTTIGATGVKVTEQPEHGKPKTLASLP